VFLFNGLDLAFINSLNFVVQAEANKVSSESNSVESGSKENDKTGSSNAKHHPILLQVHRL
jgi:hypothetical protein